MNDEMNYEDYFTGILNMVHDGSTKEEALRGEKKEEPFIPTTTEERDRLIADEAKQLSGELLRAWNATPQTIVRTPQWSKKKSSVADVVYDELSAANSVEVMFNELLSILAAVKRGEDMQNRVELWMDSIAMNYGKWHACASISDIWGPEWKHLA